MRDIDPFGGSEEGKALWALDQYVALGHDLRSEGAETVAPALALCGKAPALVRASPGLRIWRVLILSPSLLEAARADASSLGGRRVSSWTADALAARSYARELAAGMGQGGNAVVVLEGHVPEAGCALDVTASYQEAGWATHEMETWSRYAGVEEEIILDRDAWPADAAVSAVFTHEDPAFDEILQGERLLTDEGVMVVCDTERAGDGWRVWFDEMEDAFLVRRSGNRLRVEREELEYEPGF